MQDRTRSRLHWFLVLLNKEPDKTLLHSPFKIEFLKPELPLYYLMRQDTGDFVIVCAHFCILFYSGQFLFIQISWFYSSKYIQFMLEIEKNIYNTLFFKICQPLFIFLTKWHSSYQTQIIFRQTPLLPIYYNSRGECKRVLSAYLFDTT